MVTMDLGCYKGAKVFVTGHTGFKGSWLCEWLLSIGAEVYGYALKPPTSPSLFNQLRLSKRVATHVIGDVRDSKALARAVKSAQPDFIFHLAAQPIVRYSYAHPVETFDTNVMGTVNLLESCRKLKNPCAVVCVTTDKVYENDDSGKAFSENDPLGGRAVGEGVFADGNKAGRQNDLRQAGAIAEGAFSNGGHA